MRSNPPKTPKTVEISRGSEVWTFREDHDGKIFAPKGLEDSAQG
jgi:hypothetical protein